MWCVRKHQVACSDWLVCQKPVYATTTWLEFCLVYFVRFCEICIVIQFSGSLALFVQKYCDNVLCAVCLNRMKNQNLIYFLVTLLLTAGTKCLLNELFATLQWLLSVLPEEFFQVWMGGKRIGFGIIIQISGSSYVWTALSSFKDSGQVELCITAEYLQALFTPQFEPQLGFVCNHRIDV